MSVQTDCEMLSVQAMEAYARKYHVSRSISFTNICLKKTQY